MARKSLNDYRRKLRPESNSGGGSVDRNATKKEMGELQKQIIELQKFVSALEFRIDQELLPKLANIVDETTFSLEGNKVCKALSTISREKGSGIILDPLFCIGGCETMPTINPGKEAEKKSSQRSILTGLGVYLSDGLVKHANWFIRERLFKDDSQGYQMLQCPATASMDKMSSHNLLGCSASCPVCAESAELFGAPSFITPAVIHAGKSYPDAKIPIFHAIKTEEFVDSKKKDGVDRLFVHPTERLSIFALALPTLASSRKLQDQVAELLVDLYENLLVPSDTANLSLSNRYHNKRADFSLPIVQARAVDPPSLAMNECRRIVIEGYLPSTNSYIELASVCNTSDFVSRALCIKSGSTKFGKGRPVVEHPHIIHGTICDARQTLAWTVENNSAQLALGPGATVIGGVALPRALADFIDYVGEDEPHPVDESVSFLPFRRRVLAGKKGKTIVKEVDGHSKMKQILGEDLVDERLEFAIGRPPTKLELEAEALSNPFGFLPIGAKH